MIRAILIGTILFLWIGVGFVWYAEHVLWSGKWWRKS